APTVTAANVARFRRCAVKSTTHRMTKERPSASAKSMPRPFEAMLSSPRLLLFNRYGDAEGCRLAFGDGCDVVDADDLFPGVWVFPGGQVEVDLGLDVLDRIVLTFPGDLGDRGLLAVGRHPPVGDVAATGDLDISRRFIVVMNDVLGDDLAVFRKVAEAGGV